MRTKVEGMFRILAVLALMSAAVAGAFAVEPDEILSDPALEARARTISAELRCLVCQNQSIDDSNAPLARDLRLLVRERLQQGDSNEEVLEFVVARYGEFVLLRPRFSLRTLVLWLAPMLILLTAIGIGLRTVFPRAPRSYGTTPPALTGAEEERLKALLAEPEEPKND